MAKKKYYAVKVGRNCGIYEKWDDAKEQINGFSGAVYKGFSTREEAQRYIGGEEKNAVAQCPGEDELYAYVDGSFDVKTGRYAYGVVLLTSSEEICRNGVGEDREAANMRNVAGELAGAVYAMEYALNHGYSKLVIFHDYEGIARWAKDEWKANLDSTQKYKLYYAGIKDRLKVIFQKVAAHTGDHYNELADSLAKQALGIKK
ncbi:viroplasmin family protein [Acetivibrio sp. MSJd-27]|jgi:caulimovirus viroplasmin|uniref:ribonuclease H1 domain-containing protein n=1 Tax=Acetivibrio sp. MSJd-27 TaxID=2841523 RepID=UPI0015ADD79A|nr:ribonuclease H family protein [Acetivibrio sp. MSJd-27]MBU5451222.1 ribonuclease H family protein [Acetivibrio sp. MSJd-27]